MSIINQAMSLQSCLQATLWAFSQDLQIVKKTQPEQCRKWLDSIRCYFAMVLQKKSWLEWCILKMSPLKLGPSGSDLTAN